MEGLKESIKWQWHGGDGGGGGGWLGVHIRSANQDQSVPEPPDTPMMTLSMAAEHWPTPGDQDADVLTPVQCRVSNTGPYVPASNRVKLCGCGSH